MYSSYLSPFLVGLRRLSQMKTHIPFFPFNSCTRCLGPDLRGPNCRWSWATAILQVSRSWWPTHAPPECPAGRSVGPSGRMWGILACGPYLCRGSWLTYWHSFQRSDALPSQLASLILENMGCKWRVLYGCFNNWTVYYEVIFFFFVDLVIICFYSLGKFDFVFIKILNQLC